MIKIEGLKKAYAGRPVLQGINLEVRSGEFLVVLGPSGAGKSTMLRCINGLTTPDEGRILIDGTVFDAKRAGGKGRLRPVAMIFQHHNLVKRLTVLKNILVGRMAGMSSVLSALQLFPKQDVEIAMECLKRVELSHKAMSRADQLSGGEQQRIGIARALAQQPTVILCDEPVASLDPKTSRVVLGYLKAICKEEGIAVICNLHQVDYAVEFGERIVGLSGGKVIFDDTPDHLTVDVVHQIYPGLEDPGISRVLRPNAGPRLVSNSLPPAGAALAASA
jgi:phosphonate transport system ATP-binding protein